MSFVNGAMLWGLLAVAVPVVVHLLNRRRFRRVRWAAMSFLLAAQEEQRRRLRLEHLLVLLLRCLAVALFALVVARPLSAVAGLALLPGARNVVERVLVLDDSGSMRYRWRNQSSFERAVRAGTDFLETLRRERPGDLVAVHLASQESAWLPFVRPGGEGVARALEALPELQPGGRRLDLAGVLERALAREEGAEERRRVVYFLTDLRRVDWEGEGAARAARALADEAEDPQGDRVVVVDVGPRTAPNVGIVSLEPVDTLAQAGVSFEFEVRVRNFGAEPVRDLPLSLEAGGGRLPLATLAELAPGAEEAVRQRYTFAEPGPAALSVFLPGDGLDLDDRRELALEVADELAVLLLDGEDAPGPLAAETDMLRLALAPPGDERWGVAPRVVLPGDLLARELASAPMLIACNLERWPPRLLPALGRFVRAGGGLGLFLGDRVDAEAWERQLGPRGLDLLPCALGERLAAPGEEGGLRLAPPAEDHPLTRIFSGEGNPFLGRVRVLAYRSLRLDPERHAQSKVLLRLDEPGRTPFVVARPVGRGLVVLFNTTADLAWSNWPRLSSFPVVAMELVRLLAPASAAGRNLRCGEALVRPLDLARTAPTAELLLPGEEQARQLHAEEVPGGGAVLRFADTDRPGRYALRLRARTGEVREERYAVAPDPREGDLRPAAPERLQAAFPGGAVSFARPEPGQRLLALSDGERHELWRTFLYLLFAVLLAEQVLAYRAAHHRRPASAPPAGDAAVGLAPPWKIPPAGGAR
ncbi:MAG: VWA domain-containing protein [Planctomycetota bacterium]|nr:MAG: VWA domain-containing protein [Planctomycetota bacterium]